MKLSDTFVGFCGWLGITLIIGCIIHFAGCDQSASTPASPPQPKDYRVLTDKFHNGRMYGGPGGESWSQLYKYTDPETKRVYIVNTAGGIIEVPNE